LAADLPSLDLMDAGIVCSACDTFNEPDRKSCIRCGQSLAGMTGFLHAVSAHAVSAPPDPELTDIKPDLPEPTAKTDPAPPVTPQPDKQPSAKMPAPVTQAADLSARLRLVRGYGREDSTYPVGPNGITLGRSMAVVNITDDPYLSPVHMLLRTNSGKLLVEDRKSLNGTFLRVRGQAELKPGAEFIAGSQRLVLLGLGGPTTDVRTPSTPDTRPYGGPLPPQLFVALRALHATPDGKVLAGAVMLRAGPIIAIGRQGCDLNFPNDSRMASPHLELHLRPQGLQISESVPSSGIFVRISRPTPLQNGDEILAGEELFRVEMG
jgi:pSer/pThr/pTyr-binding forkhead associated (FHA) protein